MNDSLYLLGSISAKISKLFDEDNFKVLSSQNQKEFFEYLYHSNIGKDELVFNIDEVTHFEYMKLYADLDSFGANKNLITAITLYVKHQVNSDKIDQKDLYDSIVKTGSEILIEYINYFGYVNNLMICLRLDYLTIDRVTFLKSLYQQNIMSDDDYVKIYDASNRVEIIDKMLSFNNNYDYQNIYEKLDDMLFNFVYKYSYNTDFNSLIIYYSFRKIQEIKMIRKIFMELSEGEENE
ncbi:hypothetical protein [Haploplasma axanthum]|uniref:Uncharacterized protein n=1 Tax=Haploplasma axanthum TaxID=29552 RepID=A0A449BCJ8_HAPAX|nr:hypothetical protein [Haploplasma axanthum]VEU80171.1 Uncharacterised protein [Haploplasma axanthum]